MTNGGVLILRVSDGAFDNHERLIYLKPMNIPQFSIELDQPVYSPAGQVKLSVSLPEPLNAVDETFYASIVVSDMSSYFNFADKHSH